MKEIIENVEFADNKYTRVRFELLNAETGYIQNCELKVPENHEKGINKYWDLILDSFDIEKLKQERIEKIEKVKQYFEIQRQREETAKESKELQELFKVKSLYIKMPFITNDEQKRNIRQAPNIFCLDFIMFKYMDEYIKENSLSYEDVFDMIEEIIYDE